MEQGMWVSPLQTAEDTTCLGWLLYSADKYNREELRKAIWSFIGVNVALRFREIDDGIPRKEGINRPPRPKALHIEIDKNAIIYPWTAMDRKNKEKCLEKPSNIPFLLSNMKKYFHKLYI